jgi:hypothetical protein
MGLDPLILVVTLTPLGVAWRRLVLADFQAAKHDLALPDARTHADDHRRQATHDVEAAVPQAVPVGRRLATPRVRKRGLEEVLNLAREAAFCRPAGHFAAGI